MNNESKKTQVVALSILLLSPALAMAGSSSGPTPETVTGSTLNLTGTIVNAACSLSADSQNMTVNLGNITATSLAKSGDFSTQIPFSIKLADCDTTTYKTASVIFVGTPVSSSDTKALALNGEGSSGAVAKNVGVQILQADVPLDVSGATPSTKQNLLNGSNTLTFAADYVATADGATAGAGDATAQFNMQYE